MKKGVVFLLSFFFPYVFCIAGISWTEPIDIVYLWVDGNDPEWLSIKNTHLAFWLKRNDSYTDNRFADNEELRYSLRSIWQFAPFVNHIYIVTMNQRPHWILPHPKITFVNHTEIFKDQSDLPTFNSHALESNLHRIPGLGEYYIYFNDDVFLGTRVAPTDFFTPDGSAKVLFERSLSPTGPSADQETVYRKAWCNTNAFLDARYKPEPRYRLRHAPFAARKSFVEQAEREFGFIFVSNSSHRFRHEQDFNIMNGLLQYYWKYESMAVPGTIKNMMVSMRTDATITHTASRLQELARGRYHTFCIQDVMQGAASTQTRLLLRQFLEAYYPHPAPWER